MSQTNAILGTAFQDPLVVGATIDPMGMIKAHKGAMPVFIGPAQRWVPGPGGTLQELGLSELGGNPGFEAASAFIMNPNYMGPAVQSARGAVRTTAMIQAEARMKEQDLLNKAQNGTPGPDTAPAALGLPSQETGQTTEERSSINTPTPVEGLVGFDMKARQGPVAPLLTQAPIGQFPTAAEIAAAAAPRDDLAALLQPAPGVSTRDMLIALILALDVGFNGQGDLKKMRAAVASMADAARKGVLRD